MIFLSYRQGVYKLWHTSNLTSHLFLYMKFYCATVYDTVTELDSHNIDCMAGKA